MPGVSVAVCCFNSETRIAETLECIGNQEVGPDLSWEVIVVDNGSSDKTRDVAESAWRNLDGRVPLRIVVERKAGLRYAREAALAAAAHEYLIFVDDDNWLTASYVETAFHLMESNRRAAMIGGYGIPKAEIALPGWFDAVSSIYAVGKQHVQSGPIPAASGYVYGAGMVIRKSSWKRLTTLGFPFASSDRTGTSLMGGHDVELSWAFRYAGYEVLFDERLMFFHALSSKRLEWSYARRLMKGSSQNFVPFVLFVASHRKVRSQLLFCVILIKRVTSDFWESLKSSLKRSSPQQEMATLAHFHSGIFLLLHFFSAIRYFNRINMFKIRWNNESQSKSSV